jgi:hypothetical protein
VYGVVYKFAGSTSNSAYQPRISSQYGCVALTNSRISQEDNKFMLYSISKLQL